MLMGELPEAVITVNTIDMMHTHILTASSTDAASHNTERERRSKREKEREREGARERVGE